MGDAEIDETDGLSMAFADWRFNLRGSNTEPVLRLNVEGLQRDLVVIGAERIQKLLTTSAI